MDRFCKNCLGLIVLLLFVIALRPTVATQSVIAQTKKLPGASAPQPPAGASTRVWTYGYQCIDDYVSEESMSSGIGKVNSLAKDGWEVMGAFPVAGQRNDNIAMGTVNVCYILRRPN
jgi:hypothetical protein